MARTSEGQQESYRELGFSGLDRFSGRVPDEPEFMGREWIDTIIRMKQGDPVIGAVLKIIKLIIAATGYSIEPADEHDQESIDWAKRVHEAIDDMDRPFQEIIGDITTMIDFGWSIIEPVYKRRRGAKPRPYAGAPNPAASKFDDGAIGWAGWYPRGQATLWKWRVDERGHTTHFEQFNPYSMKVVSLPLARVLLFRTEAYLDNPEGQALAHETPVPTPDGWRTIGDLRVGDRVFDEQGMIRHVTACAEWEDRPTYKVVMSSGDVFVADAAHRWLTHDAAARYRNATPAIRTTEEIAASVQYGSQGTANHAIQMAKPWRYIKQNLPIDPYVLGYWLGDGCAASARITTADPEIAEFCGDLGYPTERMEGAPYGYRVGGNLQRQLRAVGVLGAKHVPDAYLQGDPAQRLALLQGLMDSDGTVDRWGRCEFTNTNPILSAAVAEIARSMGCKVAISHRDKSDHHGTINGRPVVARKDSIIVKYTPDFPAFRLPRKLAKQRFDRDFRWRRNYHYITSVTPAENRPTKCIEVDSPSHLFLIGWNGVPTHNSSLRAAWRPWYFKTHIEQVEAIGVERDLSGLPIVWVPPEYLKEDAPDSDKDLVDEMLAAASGVRLDEKAALAMPLAYDPNSRQKSFDFTLMSTSSRRQYDTGSIIQRYDHRIALSFLAQFMMLGSSDIGSFALASTHQEMFNRAINSYLSRIAGVINKREFPRFVAMNGGDEAKAPRLQFAQVQAVDIDALSSAIMRFSQSGMRFFPSRETEDHLLKRMGIPIPDDEDRPASGPPLGARPAQGGGRPPSGDAPAPEDETVPPEDDDDDEEEAPPGTDPPQ